MSRPNPLAPFDGQAWELPTCSHTLEKEMQHSQDTSPLDYGRGEFLIKIPIPIHAELPIQPRPQPRSKSFRSAVLYGLSTKDHISNAVETLCLETTPLLNYLLVALLTANTPTITTASVTMAPGRSRSFGTPAITCSC